MIIRVTLFLNLSETGCFFFPAVGSATKAQQQPGSVCDDLGFAFPISDFPRMYCSPVSSHLVLCPSALLVGHFDLPSLHLHPAFPLNFYYSITFCLQSTPLSAME